MVPTALTFHNYRSFAGPQRISILRNGMHGRFGVRTRPAFRRDPNHRAHRWIASLADKNSVETARRAFVQGLRWTAYAHEGQRRESEVILEPREQPQWPTSFDEGPARLPLGHEAQRLLERFFDLLDDGDQPFRLLRRRRESPQSTWLPLDILLDSFALGEFKDILRRDGYPRTLVNRVQAIADVLRDYTIPVIPMATEDLEQVTTSFNRVNSGGTTMSEVHMVNALTWTEDFDLLERMEDLEVVLNSEGWGSFDPQMILNVCKARFDLDIYKASAEELAKILKNKPAALDEATDAIARAANVLREIGIHGREVLPYSYQAVLLADALRSRPPVDESIKRSIWRWVWITTLTEYFQAMTGSLFRRAQEHLRRLVEGKAESSPPDQPSTIDPLIKFDFRGARSRAMALLIAEQGPRSPINCKKLPAHALLAEYGDKALIPLIPARSLPKNQRRLAQGLENRFLLPPREGAKLREALLLGPGRAEFARSHVIPERALKALEEDDPVTVLEARQQALWDLERQRAEEVGLVYRDDPPEDS